MRLPALALTLPLLLVRVTQATLWCQELVAGSLRIQRLVDGEPVATYPLGEITQLKDAAGNNYLGVNVTASRFTFVACDSTTITNPGVLTNGNGYMDVFGKIRWTRTIAGRTQTGCLTRNQAGAVVFGQCAVYDGPEQLTQLWYTILSYNVSGGASGADRPVHFADLNLNPYHDIQGGMLYGEQFLSAENDQDADGLGKPNAEVVQRPVESWRLKWTSTV